MRTVAHTGKFVNVASSSKKGVLNLTDIQVKYWDLQEKKRSNLINEAETHRSNVAREKETNRSNVANETEMRRSNLAREKETNRHNLVTEGLEFQKVSETKRHNLVSEGLESSKIEESKRHNVALEGLESSKQSETKRHNQWTEGLGVANAAISAVDTVWGNINDSVKLSQNSKKKGTGLDTVLKNAKSAVDLANDAAALADALS